MNPRSNIILWLVATAAVAGLTAWAVTTRVTPSAGPPAPELSLHQWMHQELALSLEQHRILEPLELAYEKERAGLRQEIADAGAALALAVKNSEPAAAVLARQSSVNEAQGRLQQATLRHFLEMKQHLTPAQAEKLAHWTHDSILLQPAP